MRLVMLSAKNYRTLQSINVSLPKDYCTISGRNNAGKSCIIRLLTGLLARTYGPFEYGDETLDYALDKTQWIKAASPIEIQYDFELNRDDDPALISFIEKISALELTAHSVGLRVRRVLNHQSNVTVEVLIDGSLVDSKAAEEIERRLRESNLLFVYNSTVQNEDIYFAGGRRRTFFDFVMTNAERKALEVASKTTEKKIAQLAKDHVEGLTEILDKLADRYQVELLPPEGFTTRRMPLSINLTDKSVRVPINDWGSGTQNRTHILMAILRANRIKLKAPPNDKITPMVVIEEPESFLHPSAQAEFGRLLRQLSAQFGIQIIVTTHSPYMLNQENPAANILLSRKTTKHKLSETIIVPTSGEKWMAPFADHLGIKPEEFVPLRSMFSADQSKVLLVEGPIDVEYFRFLKSSELQCQQLNAEIEVSAYGGKDTLKNTVLLQFVLAKFDKVFVTYDLDAKDECCVALGRAGLASTDHTAIGIKSSGKECIEGLLPNRVLAAVNGRETDLVMKLGSKDRREAKNQLKKKYLEEFVSGGNYTAAELKPLSDLVKVINAKLLQV